MGVDPKIGGFYPQKMDGLWFLMENPYFLMDDLGVKPIIFGKTHIHPTIPTKHAWLQTRDPSFCIIFQLFHLNFQRSNSEHAWDTDLLRAAGGTDAVRIAMVFVSPGEKCD